MSHGGSDGASISVVDDNTFGLLNRRLYALALGSVVLSLALAIAVSELRQPPPHPGMVRSALSQLQRVLDDDVARVAELERLKNDADLELALYSGTRALVASSSSTPPPLPAELPVVRDRDRDRDRRPDDRADDFADKKRRGDRPFMGKPGLWWLLSSSSFVHALAAPSGAVYYVVTTRPGEWPFFLGGAIGVVIVLGLLSWAFASTLARPLRELGRATRAFGQGDVNTRVDVTKAGAFASLARAFNHMAEKVTSARRAERELLANVSHELRTPLSRIRVALDIADEGDAHLARESLADIGTDLAELETIIEDILTATRLESGQLTTAPALRLTSTAPSTLVDAVAHRFRSAHHRHTLVIACEDPLPLLSIDAVLVRRALDNFLDNAGKYAAPASTVRLSVRRVGDDVVFAIEDAGAGIAVEDQAQLFTPFFRADKSRTRSTGGVGLGLVLSRRIIEAHGGTVTLTSTPGVGTTVTVKLPTWGKSSPSPAASP